MVSFSPSFAVLLSFLEYIEHACFYHLAFNLRKDKTLDFKRGNGTIF